MAKIINALMQPMNKAGSGILGGYMITWGFWLGSPFWDAFDSSPMYRYLSTIVPEGLAGFVAVGIGLLIIISLRMKNYSLLQFGSGLSMWFWLIFTLLCFFGDWQNPSVITYLVMFSYSTFVYENIRMNLKISKDEHQNTQM